MSETIIPHPTERGQSGSKFYKHVASTGAKTGPLFLNLARMGLLPALGFAELRL